MTSPAAVTPYLAVGGLCGLTWAASVRGWLVELAPGGSTSSLTWLTVLLLLLPACAGGVLLGWSAYLHSVGIPGRRWLVLSPALLTLGLPTPVVVVVIATALGGGYALSGRRWSPSRAFCALVAALGLLVIGSLSTTAAPLSTARGAWICLYGVTLAVLLCLASALPHQPVRPPRASRSWVALGALGGLAWACALRSFMAAVAGAESAVEWGHTFGYILLPGAVIGALLGRSELLRRRTGGASARHRLAYAPLLFGAVLVPGLFHPGTFLQDGIGGGAIGVPVLAMLGGLAISGRGPGWGRALAGLGFTTGFGVWLLTASSVGGDGFALDTAHGLWVSVLFESLLVTFALAASVPHRADAVGAGAPLAVGVIMIT